MKMSWSDTDIAKMNPAGPGLHRVRLISVDSKPNAEKTGVNWVYEFVVDDANDKENTQSLTFVRPIAFKGLHADMHAALLQIQKEEFDKYRDYDTDELIGKTAYVHMKKELDKKTQNMVNRDKDWYIDKGERPPVDE